MIKYLILIIIVIFSVTSAQQSDSTGFYDVDENWEDDYSAYEGRIIRNIIYKLIDVSGPSVDSKNGEDSSWFSKLSNSLHFKTKEWVVRDLLLFSEGEFLEAKLISESERLIRLSGFFLDARIQILETNPDSVDILVTTKDRWTLTLNLAYHAAKESYFGLKDDNLLGLGHSIDASVTHSNDNRIGLGGKANYTAYNIAGTYINGSLDFLLNKKVNTQAIGLSRPFISTELDWAGGVEFKRESDELLYQQPGSSVFLPIRTRNYDLWVGKSFPVWFGEKTFRDKTRFIISARVNKLEHTSVPDENYGLEELFKNSIFYLGKAGFINQRFYRDYYIEGFGHTEDVPIGGIIAVTVGTDKRGSTSRFYSGARGIYSRRILNFGYASFLVDLGGFRRGNEVEQTIYNFNFLYHSPLLLKNDWRFRFFFQGDYLLGFKRFQGEQIFLNEETGIKGIEGSDIFGSKRGVINLEARIFSPYSLLGFVFGANLFADFGLISGSGKSLIHSRLFQGYGAGLRLSNESIARAQFSVGVVYNPYIPLKPSGSFSLVLSGSFVIGIRNYEFLRPYIIGFQQNN